MAKYAQGIIDLTDLPNDLAAGDSEAAALYAVLVSEGLVNDTDDLPIFCENAGVAVSDYQWVDYVKSIAYETDAFRRGDDWPLCCVDWEWAARELANDYASFDVGGVVYYIRAW